MTSQAAKIEAHWRSMYDPALLLREVGDEMTARKRRLFACACCRQMEEVWANAGYRNVIEVVEQFADGRVPAAEMRSAFTGAQPIGSPWAREALLRLMGSAEADTHTLPDVYFATEHAARAIRDAAGERDWAAARRGQVPLLCDLAGNQIYAPVIEPIWLRANGGTALKVARAIYEDNGFGDLPVLADALEEAGCTDLLLLAHCRGPTGHWRGCWVVDAILGKG